MVNDSLFLNSEFKNIIDEKMDFYRDGKIELFKLREVERYGSDKKRFLVKLNQTMLSVMSANKHLQFSVNKNFGNIVDFTLTDHDMFYRDISKYLLEGILELNASRKVMEDYDKQLKVNRFAVYKSNLNLYSSIIKLSFAHYMVVRALEVTEDSEDSKFNYNYVFTLDSDYLNLDNKPLDDKFNTISDKLKTALSLYGSRTSNYRTHAPVGAGSCMSNYNSPDNINELLPFLLELEETIELMGTLIYEDFYRVKNRSNVEKEDLKFNIDRQFKNALVLKH